MNKRLYIAYGSNLNIAQMKFRCPTAKLYGTGRIENYELQFKGHPGCAYATIGPRAGSSVPVAVWDITPSDEMSLDSYEGYPSHYFKRDVTVTLNNGETINGMAYIMNLKMDFALPSKLYYCTVRVGYENMRLDVSYLDNALMNSTYQYFRNSYGYNLHQSSFIDDEEEFIEDEEETEDEDEDESEDINDPFYYFSN